MGIMNEDDSFFCGFVKLQILDQDAYLRGVKGSEVAAPMHLKREGGKVFLEAQFAGSPLYYLEVQRQADYYLSGQMWYGDAKASPTNAIGKVVPKSCEQIVTTMEKTNTNEFTLKVEVPFLRNSADRLVPLKFVTREERFLTKVSKCSLELSEADWKEWKEYRLRFWRASKAWGLSGQEGGDDDDKKKDDKEKDEEKK